MSGPYTIFAKNVGGRNESERFQFILSSEKESPLKRVSPIKLRMIESFSSVTPIIQFTFIDGSGELMNKGKIDYDNTFYIDLGRNMEKILQSAPLRVATIKNTSQVPGKNMGLVYTITFFIDGWDKIMSQSHNRTWRRKSFAEVAEIIATECKYPKLEIEEAEKTDRIIQANIPNNKMIRQASRSAESISFDDPMEYGCTLQGKFYFKTFSKMIEEHGGGKSDTPIMYMSNGLPGDQTDNIEKNNGFPMRFYTFGYDENYSSHTIEGGSGMDVSYYDFSKGKYIREEVGQKDINMKSLSDLPTLTDKDESKTYKVFGGRDIKTVEKAKRRLGGIVNSYNSYVCLTDYTIKANIGKIVELIFPLMDVNPNEDDPISIPYSGMYLITGVQHEVDMQKNTMATELHVTRKGYNK